MPIAMILGVVFLLKRKTIGGWQHELNSDWGLSFGTKESYVKLSGFIGIMWILIPSIILLMEILTPPK
jgi:hypothetical protein